MRWKTLAAAAAALATAPALIAGSAQAAPRAVLELFTSPFCSSCPPADALFTKLAQQPDLITLVMPVDSFGRPGRKDTLSKPVFTDRQAAYAERRNSDVLYTPQAMINGAAEAQGSDAREIRDGIAQTMNVISVPVEAKAEGKHINLSVGEAGSANAKSGVITVLPFMKDHTVPMRGGRSLHYANLVRDIIPVDTWSGVPIKARLLAQDFAQYDGIVVLLQAGTAERPGAIIGATRISFADRPKT